METGNLSFHSYADHSLYTNRLLIKLSLESKGKLRRIYADEQRKQIMKRSNNNFITFVYQPIQLSYHVYQVFFPLRRLNVTFIDSWEFLSRLVSCRLMTRTWIWNNNKVFTLLPCRSRKVSDKKLPTSLRQSWFIDSLHSPLLDTPYPLTKWKIIPRGNCNSSEICVRFSRIR